MLEHNDTSEWFDHHVQHISSMFMFSSVSKQVKSESCTIWICEFFLIFQTDISKFLSQAFQPQSRRTAQHMDGCC